MVGLKPTCLWLLFSLTSTALAHPESDLRSLHLTNDIEKREPTTTGLHKRCIGSCVECFGAGYEECASDSSICFKPGDALHGEESCSSSGTTNTDIPLPTVPAAPTSDFDFCSKGDCATCFGSGYEQCPDSTLYCYKPGDSLHGLDSCTSSGSDSDSSSSSSGSGSSSSGSGFNTTTTDYCDNGSLDCGRCFGGTYTACPDSSQTSLTKYCYDPNNSTSVCPDDIPSAGGAVGGSGSAGSSSATFLSTSASYTASTLPGTTNTGSPDTSSSGAVGTAGSDSGATAINIQTSSTSTSSRTTSTASSSQTPSASGNADSSPISASASGQPSMFESVFGLLAMIALCFATLAGFLI